MPPKAKADAKGKGKAKAKDTDASDGAGKGKGKGLKPATSINARHILVCHFPLFHRLARCSLFAFVSKRGTCSPKSYAGRSLCSGENLSIAAGALPV
jgi:hypothetical protein